MSPIDILLKSLILLINEQSVFKKLKSGSIVKEILEETTDNKKAKTFGDDNEILEQIRDTIKNVIDGSTEANEELLVSIEMMLVTKPMLFKVIDKYVKKNNEKVINSLTNELNKTLTRIKVKKLLQHSLNRSLNPLADPLVVLADVGEFLQKTKGKGNKYSSSSIIDKINFKDEQSVTDAAKRAVELITGGTVMKTAWECFNNMTQGGPRRGETVSVAALPHNYKSSFTKSLFLQVARHNTPSKETNKLNKKPMLLFISLEEEIDNIMFFFYTYLKFTLENHIIKKKEQKELDPIKVSEYVYKELEKTGFHIEVLRVRPDLLDINEFEKIIEGYEADGFELYGLFLDYAKKMSRKGLNHGGANGTDLLELFSRTRNITSAKNILYVVPHQLNTSSKQLLKNGLPDNEFTQYIANKGYYAESSQLDQEIDLELFLHLIKKRGQKTTLSISRGKHRIPTTITEEEKRIELVFSNHLMPIPESNEHHTEVCKKNDVEEDDFDF